MIPFAFKILFHILNKKKNKNLLTQTINEWIFFLKFLKHWQIFIIWIAGTVQMAMFMKLTWLFG